MPSLPNLRITRQELKAIITVQIDKAKSVLTGENEIATKGFDHVSKRFKVWDKYNRDTLKESFDADDLEKEYSAIAVQPSSGTDNKAKAETLNALVYQKKRWLDNFLKTRLNLYKAPPQYISTIHDSENHVQIINRICSRFHVIARQLRQRHEDRQTLDITDEHDVQDLLHALLRLHFDDVRNEEVSPSYAGGGSRIDFLLKKEQTVIEVKKTRPSLRAKQLGAELIIDIARYQSHPDCKMLYCFVYDPDGYITNPRGIENDLSRTEGNLIVKVDIAPKG